MANLVFNYSKGSLVEYGGLKTGNDRLLFVLLLASGLPSDATLRDLLFLSEVLDAGATVHPGGRKMISWDDGVLRDTDVSGDRSYFTANPIVFTNLATSGALGALLVCYVEYFDNQQDSQTKLLTKHDLSVTPNGGNLTLTPASTGIAQAV